MKKLKLTVAALAFLFSTAAYGQSSSELLLTFSKFYGNKTIGWHNEQCEIECNLNSGNCTIKIGEEKYNQVITAIERKKRRSIVNIFYNN